MRSSSLLACVLLGAVGCGGAAATAPAGGATAAAKPNSTVEDQEINVEALPISGHLWQPDALGRPGMVMLDGSKKASLDKLRTAYQKAQKPADKETAAQILATALYRASQADKLPAEQATKLHTEARDLLRELNTALAGKAESITLRMLGVLELVLGNDAAAAAVYQELAERFPNEDHAAASRGWWAHSLLRLGKNAEAAAAIQGKEPSDKEPELAYVIAWARWRTGDGPGAAKAIAAAARGWRAPAFKKEIDRDTIVMLARGGATVAEAVEVIADANKNQRDAVYEGLFALHSAFVAAGRFADAAAILDRAAERVGTKIQPADAAKFRLLQADYMLRAGSIERVVELQEQALAAYRACGDKCTADEQEAAALSTRNLATFLDAIFRTSQDERFFGPAARLYELYLAQPNRKDAGEVLKFAEDSKMMRGRARTPAVHDPARISTWINLRAAGISACYERVLAGAPTVEGLLSVRLELAPTGEATGVSTDPAAGQEGLAAVAACAAEVARGWSIPARTKQGVTRVTAKYLLSVGKK